MVTVPAPGVLVGSRYRVDHLLGEGGMGVVWAADDLEGGCPVALKFLKDAGGDKRAALRLIREARAAAAVHHPNVVRVLDLVVLEDGAPVLVLERLFGESLAERLRRVGRLELADAAETMLPIVSAVGAAHALGIVHRDLKPENVFLARGPHGTTVPKVLDFGIAQVTVLDDATARSTGLTTGMVLGTPAYMAPEQLFGEKDIDHRADIWALGLMLYQAFSGVLPTAGDNLGQIFKNVLAGPFRPLEELVPGLPEDLAALVGRMLSRSRGDRPDDLRPVQEILGKYADLVATEFGAPARSAFPEEGAPGSGAPSRDDPAWGEAPTLAAPRGPPGSSAPPPAAPAAPAPPALLGSRRLAADWGEAPTQALPKPPRAPVRAARPGARRLAAGLVAAAGLSGALTAGALLWPRARAAPAARPLELSPLVAEDAVLACPLLEASGVAEPAGWLGAAAAATVCERARVLLGGRVERTLVPAELLGLPRRPIDEVPADPYGLAEARARSLASARRAAAYVDGEVVAGASGFRVALTLRRPDGAELGRAAGEGRGLYEAVRQAMNPMVDAGLLPKASALDPAIAAWSPAVDVDGALALVDLTLGLAQNAGGLPEECARVEARRSGLGAMAPFSAWLCARTLGLPEVTVDLPADDATATGPAGFAERARLEHMVRRSDPPAALERLHALLLAEASPWGRALLATTESCLAQATDPTRAYELALAAVQAEPKNTDGQLCSPWSQVLAMTRDTASADSAVRAAQSWTPWDSNAWELQADGPGDPALALTVARRAYVLSPFDASAADVLADKLLAAGAREEARGVAVALLAGGQPVHAVERDLLFLRVDVSEARFGAALARARQALTVSAGEGGWVLTQRLEIGWRALEVAVLLGRGAEVADLLVERFVDPEPAPLDGVDLATPMRVPALCALASRPVSLRCFARFEALRGRLSGGIRPGTDAFVLGARCYARGDVAGAARAWSPLMRGPSTLLAAMSEEAAETFARAGDDDLATRLDAVTMDRAPELNGATPAHVRAARRAAARGDRDAARRLAEQVITAWSVADETVPAVAEMRRLLEQLRR